MTTEVVTWLDIEKAVVKMAKEYKKRKYKCTHIYGIPRGGMLLAVMLSHKLELPMLDFMNDGDLEETPDKVLLIDDITTTGETLGVYKEQGDIVFTMHRHAQTTVEPDFYVHKMKTSSVEYPWEIDEKESN